MGSIDARVKTWLIWALPFALIALLVGWETDWGHALKRVPPPDAGVGAQPVAIALLPEYRIDGGTESRRETIERTLFNPTRRAAPPQAAASATPKLQAGQFVLTGTTVVDQKASAFLREVNGGRSRRVQQGETINGMLVAEVRADRVKLTVGPDAELLTLKVATGPKTTIQPQVAAPPPPQPQPSAPAAAQNAAGAQPGQIQDTADVLASRRRAARAAADANQGQQPGQSPQAAPTPQQPVPAQQSPGAANGTWNDTYQRYIQRQK